MNENTCAGLILLTGSPAAGEPVTRISPAQEFVFIACASRSLHAL